MSGPARLYDADFRRRTQEQAALLRRVPNECLNLPVDWNHIEVTAQVVWFVIGSIRKP